MECWPYTQPLFHNPVIDKDYYSYIKRYYQRVRDYVHCLSIEFGKFFKQSYFFPAVNLIIVFGSKLYLIDRLLKGRRVVD